MEKSEFKLNNERIIAEYHGGKPGPLLIAIGAMHGNEPMGIKAIAMLEKMLDVEHITNPGFEFQGSFVGLIGNLNAYKRHERFIDKDMNRQWSKEHIDNIKNLNPDELDAEDLEMLDILQSIADACAKYNPTKLYILDLHTTSSFGGIFSIPAENKESLEIAKSLHAPVVMGMLKGIKGTSLHYFRSENMPLETVTITFEAGQHEEHKSINRAIAAIVNLLRTVSMVESDDVENIHDQILLEYSRNLPKVTELVLRYGVSEEDEFKMKPGFTSFQKVQKGEVLATDKHGQVLSPETGRLLMPLYQAKGEDGFFLIKDVK